MITIHCLTGNLLLAHESFKVCEWVSYPRQTGACSSCLIASIQFEQAQRRGSVTLHSKNIKRNSFPQKEHACTWLQNKQLD